MKRNKILDSFRFIAIFLVMMSHYEIAVNAESSNILDKALLFLHDIGRFGVDLFFVLSGFLVSGLIFKEYNKHGTFSPGRFLIRRGFKIYPTYYVYIFCITSMALISTHTINIGKLVSQIFFYFNYTTYIFQGPGLLWSICVEEHFYFVLSFLFFYFIKRKNLTFKNILAIYIMFLGVGIIAKTINYFLFSDVVFFRDMAQSHQRLDALFFGVFLCYLYNYKKEFIVWITKNKYIIIASCFTILALLFTLFLKNVPKYTYAGYLGTVLSSSIYPICFGLPMLILFLSNKINKSKFLSPFATIGMYSYPIYLFHPWITHLTDKLHFGLYSNLIIYLSCSIALGVVISKVVEYPMLKLRDKLYPSKSE